MEERQLMDLYYKFIRDHHSQINEKLLDAYNHYYSHDHELTIKNGTFGAFVGIPLFVVWLIWGSAFDSTLEQLLPAAVLIILGFCVRFYGQSLVTSAYRSSFRMREYKDVLIWYVDQCRQIELSKIANSEKDRVNEIYNYFQKHIILEDFQYYQKQKKRN